VMMNKSPRKGLTGTGRTSDNAAMGPGEKALKRGNSPGGGNERETLGREGRTWHSCIHEDQKSESVTPQRREPAGMGEHKSATSKRKGRYRKGVD